MITVTRSLISLLLLADIVAGPRLSTAPPPRPPMNTVETGLVILDMDITPSGQASKIDTAQGTPPFVEASLDSARQWVFEPLQKGRGPARVAGIFLFRARTLLPDRPFAVNVPREEVAGDTAPRPITITDPGYPIQSAAEGVVILQLQIDASGRVRKTEVIRDVPSLTWTATHAVSQWRFGPALHAGRPVPGIAIASISFLRPVLSH